MKVTIKDEYLEIQLNEDSPILCIDPNIAGYLLYDLFYNGVESMSILFNILMKQLEEEEDD